MRLLSTLLLLAVACGWAGMAAAQAVSTRPDAVSITLYRDRPISPRELASARTGGYGVRGGLVFVTETRTLDVPAGRSTVEFRGVADGIVAQSATLQGVDGRVVEQNLDYDLLSPGSLTESAVGRRATLVRTNPVTGVETSVEVTVQAAPTGVVLRTADGVEALGCSGGPERLVFDGLPPSLRDEPTLSAVVRSQRAGRRRVTLSYLAVGLSWSADYVARISPDDRTLDLTGWLTLANFGRTTFAGAPTQVVAGRLMRDESTQSVAVVPTELSPGCWPINTGFAGEQNVDGIVVTGSRMRRDMAEMGLPPPPPPPPPMMAAPAPVVSVVSDLGDYKLYSLPEPTTMAAQSTKQVRFLERRAVPFDRVYRLTVDENTGHADVVLVLRNTEAGGLGVALPEGSVTAMGQASDGRATLIGQARLPRDGPVGLPVEIGLGRSSQVQGAMRVVSQDADAPEGSRTIEVAVSNARPVAVIVEVRDRADGRQIVEQSSESSVRDARFVWRVEVPANARTTVRYVIAAQGAGNQPPTRLIPLEAPAGG